MDLYSPEHSRETIIGMVRDILAVSGFNPQEIDRLLFLKWRLATGRLTGANAAARAEADAAPASCARVTDARPA